VDVVAVVVISRLQEVGRTREKTTLTATSRRWLWA
jgi:hypothetical protein